MFTVQWKNKLMIEKYYLKHCMIRLVLSGEPFLHSCCGAVGENFNMFETSVFFLVQCRVFFLTYQNVILLFYYIIINLFTTDNLHVCQISNMIPSYIWKICL